ATQPFYFICEVFAMTLNLSELADKTARDFTSHVSNGTCRDWDTCVSWHAARILAAMQQVQLEEAKWWEHLAGDHHHDLDIKLGQEECLYCQRIADLQAACGKETR